jgi:Ca2+-binding EF-hand superfamily protein
LGNSKLTKDKFKRFWKYFYSEEISNEFEDNFWNAINSDGNSEITFKEFMLFESVRKNEFQTIEDYVNCNFYLK